MFHRWTAQTKSRAPAWIMPDGCRDVIWMQRPGGAPRIELTEIDLHARQVSAPLGTTYVGFRLPPAVWLAEWPGDAEPVPDPDQLGRLIAAHVEVDPDIATVLAELGTPAASLTGAIGQTGLSQRSVERKFRDRGLPRPDIWRQMAQARQAAVRLAEGLRLADLAAEAGYSDQAHMTRAFRRWFAATPLQIARDPVLRRGIAQSGLGNWTAVHSSIS